MDLTGIDTAQPSSAAQLDHHERHRRRHASSRNYRSVPRSRKIPAFSACLLPAITMYEKGGGNAACFSKAAGEVRMQIIRMASGLKHAGTSLEKILPDALPMNKNCIPRCWRSWQHGNARPAVSVGGGEVMAAGHPGSGPDILLHADRCDYIVIRYNHRCRRSHP